MAVVVRRWGLGVAVLALLAALVGVAEAGGPAEGRCFTWEGVSVVVGGETDDKGLGAMMEEVAGNGVSKYQLSGTNPRWTTTATNVSVPLRSPFTLTYSFVPDGTRILEDPFGATGPSNMVATVNGGFPGGLAAWKLLVGQALREWGELSGITYVEVGDDGADFPVSPGVLGVRGDVRISMHPIPSTTGNVLAYNWFPNRGDMVLDSADIDFFANASGNFLRMRNTMAHEHGHGLGYRHVDPQNGTKLMESIITTGFDGPREDEIRGLQRQYGDWAEVNDGVGTAYELGMLPAPASGEAVLLALENVALEDDGLQDHYAFSTPAGAELDVRVTPVGTSYQEGPSGGALRTIDGLRVHDLAFDVLDVDGTTVLATRNLGGVGVEEALAGLSLEGGAGRRFVRVRAVTATDDVQRYELRVGYRLSLPGTIRVAPPEIYQTAVTGQSAGDQVFVLHNDGPGQLDYTVGDDSSLLTVSPGSGSIGSGGSANLTIVYSTGSLAMGEYTATITVSSPNATNSPVLVPVRLRVTTELPRIVVSPGLLRIVKGVGANAGPAVLLVSNGGGFTLNYSVEDNAGWFSVSPSVGTSKGEPDALTVTFDAGSLALGLHSGTITIISGNGSNSPVMVPVELIVTDLNGWSME